MDDNTVRQDQETQKTQETETKAIQSDPGTPGRTTAYDENQLNHESMMEKLIEQVQSLMVQVQAMEDTNKALQAQLSDQYTSTSAPGDGASDIETFLNRPDGPLARYMASRGITEKEGK